MRMDDESRINDEGSGSNPGDVLGSSFFVQGMIALRSRVSAVRSRVQVFRCSGAGSGSGPAPVPVPDNPYLDPDHLRPET